MKKEAFYKTGLACAVACLILANTAKAATCGGVEPGYCLMDGNARFEIFSNGDMSMMTNGLTYLYANDFIIEQVTGDGVLRPVSAKDYIDFTQLPSTNSHLTLSNLAVSDWGMATLDIQVFGGFWGSYSSTLIQSFTITNISATAVDVNLFTYSDVDVGGGISYLDDWAMLKDFDLNGSPVSFLQYDGIESHAINFSIAPDYYEVGSRNECIDDLCERVYNFNNTILPSTIFDGLNDLEMAAEWVRTLAPGESFTYNQVMNTNRGGALPNQAPVSDAGGDQTYTSRQNVMLDGQGSNDIDGQIVAYQWTQISGKSVKLKTTDQAVVTFIAPKVRRNTTAEFIFELRVTDDDGATDVSTATITVSDL